MSTASASRISVRAAFDVRHNSINFLRLALAGLVVVVHAWPIGGYSDANPFPFGVDPGLVILGMFFVISGFVMTESLRRRPTLLRFFWHRVLRLFPAFWVCLAVIAFGFGPASWIAAGRPLSTYFSAADGPLHFMLSNAGLRIADYEVAGTPLDVPFAHGWDRSLWTLKWEFSCWIAVGVLAAVRLLRPRVMLTITGLLWAATLAKAVDPSWPLLAGHHEREIALRFGLVFCCGSLLSLYSDRIRYSHWLGVLALAVLVGSLVLPEPHVLLPFALTYVMVWLAIALPCAAIGARNDYSYGIYIYAFPAQQALAIAGLGRLPVAAFIALSLLATAPLAAFSWWCVERPSKRLRDLSLRRKAAPALPPIPLQVAVVPRAPEQRQAWLTRA